MNVALLIKKFGEEGGVERYVWQLAKRLAGKGVRLNILCRKSDAKKIKEAFPAAGIQIHSVGGIYVESVSSVLSFALASAGVARNLKERRAVDVVASFDRTLYQDVVRIGHGCHREWLKRRGMIEGKTFVRSLSPLHRAILYLEKKQFNESQAIISNSKLGKIELTEHYGIDPDKIQVIYNGVDLSRFTPVAASQKEGIRKELGLSERRAVLLFVGSGFWRKGLSFAIRTLPFLKNLDPLLVVVGGGKVGPFFRLAEKLGVSPFLRFIGKNSEVEKWYQAADIFFLPSIYEPFSNACLEALASGLPLVLPENTGAGEVIEEGITGFAVSDIRASREMAICVEKALLLDREKLQIAKERILTSFSWERNCEQVLNLFEKIGTRS